MAKRKKIVFLDQGHFQKQKENFDYSALHQLGEFIAYESTPPQQILERSIDADVVIVLKTVLTAAIIEQLTHTKLICKLGTGTNNIDIASAKARGIPVINFPGYSTFILAQWTMTLVLALACQLIPYDKATKNNQWLSSQFTYPVYEINQKTLGLIGYGHVGKQVAKCAAGMGMNVIVNSNYPEPADGIRFVDRESIYQQADFLSLHCLLDDSTRAFIDHKVFAKMQATSYLINASRAGLICKESLLAALKNRRIAGAAIDGFWEEPPPKDDPLFFLDNIIITPHVAWSSHHTRQNLLNQAAAKIKNTI